MNDSPGPDDIRKWAWGLEGASNQASIARCAASRVVDVWETVPRNALKALSWGSLGEWPDAIALPRQLLSSDWNPLSLEDQVQDLLALLHTFAYPDGHGPHEFAHGTTGTFHPNFPPFEILESAEASPWLFALSSLVHAVSAATWRPDRVPKIADLDEYQAQINAGPIRATVEACITSFIARPTDTLDSFVAALTEGHVQPSTVRR